MISRFKKYSRGYASTFFTAVALAVMFVGAIVATQLQNQSIKKTSIAQACSPIPTSQPVFTFPINGSTIDPGVQAITWTTPQYVTSYALRIDNTEDPYLPPLTGRSATGDVRIDNWPSNSYPYDFIAGKQYSLWIHGINNCNQQYQDAQGNYNPGYSIFSVRGPITPTPTNTLTPTPNTSGHVSQPAVIVNVSNINPAYAIKVNAKTVSGQTVSCMSTNANALQLTGQCLPLDPNTFYYITAEVLLQGTSVSISTPWGHGPGGNNRTSYVFNVSVPAPTVLTPTPSLPKFQPFPLTCNCPNALSEGQYQCVPREGIQVAQSVICSPNILPSAGLQGWNCRDCLPFASPTPTVINSPTPIITVAPGAQCSIAITAHPVNSTANLTSMAVNSTARILANFAPAAGYTASLVRYQLLNPPSPTFMTLSPSEIATSPYSTTIISGSAAGSVAISATGVVTNAAGQTFTCNAQGINITVVTSTTPSVNPTAVPTAVPTAAPTSGATSTPKPCLTGGTCPLGFRCSFNQCIPLPTSKLPTTAISPASTTVCKGKAPRDPKWSPGVVRNNKTLQIGWENESDGLISIVEVCIDGGGTCKVIFQGVTKKVHSITKTVNNIGGKDILVQITTLNSKECDQRSETISRPLAAGTSVALNTPAATITNRAAGTSTWIIVGAAFTVILIIVIGLVGM